MENKEIKNKLKEYLSKIDNIFGIDQLIKDGMDEKDVISYYIASRLGYKFFHSSKGSIHMALNFDGNFDKDGYYEQAEYVEKWIKENNYSKILEIGCGNGFNSLYLAKMLPNVQFTGIDLTTEHIVKAQAKAKELGNLNFEIGNFQQLDFEEETFDLVFEVESLCHSTDLRKAFGEISRVLISGGHLIVFDGFRMDDFNLAERDMKIAAKLSELSMAVNQGVEIRRWLELANENDLKLLELRDISNAIVPNLIRFQILAGGFFKYPLISKILIKLLPINLVKNSIAGLLMPFTIKAGVQKYLNIILEKDG